MTQPGLTRDQILGMADLRIEAVDVPEWGGVVYVRNLNGKGRDLFEGSRVKLKSDNKSVELSYDNTRARLVALSACDASGVLLFTEADVLALGEKNASALDRIFDVAQRLSGLRPEDAETNAKNSVTVQTGSSGIS